jgi:hypothetical protein
MLCLGTFMAGMFGAVVHSYRFAAADTASPAFRPKAISWVLAGGVASGFIGPQVVIAMNDFFDPILFAGAFLGQAGLALLSIRCRCQFRRSAQAGRSDRSQQGARSVRCARSPQPRFQAALLSAIVAYALMALAMTAAPLAMIACGHSVGEAALGIQWHVIGMFAPSFFTGSLITRFGVERIILTGFAILGGLRGGRAERHSVGHFWVALVLLGVGWNLCFLGATSMLTECYRPEERNTVQGWNDFILFGFVAFASFSSGGLLHLFGWDVINWLLLPILALAALFLRCAGSTRPSADPPDRIDFGCKLSADRWTGHRSLLSRSLFGMTCAALGAARPAFPRGGSVPHQPDKKKNKLCALWRNSLPETGAHRAKQRFKGSVPWNSFSSSRVASCRLSTVSGPCSR